MSVRHCDGGCGRQLGDAVVFELWHASFGWNGPTVRLCEPCRRGHEAHHPGTLRRLAGRSEWPWPLGPGLQRWAELPDAERFAPDS